MKIQELFEETPSPAEASKEPKKTDKKFRKQVVDFYRENSEKYPKYTYQYLTLVAKELAHGKTLDQAFERFK